MNEVIEKNNTKLKYEYLKFDAAVENKTAYIMRITGSNLSWGKWKTSPTDVAPYSKMNFSYCGRNGSPLAVEGWVTWTLEGHPDSPKIIARFDNPTSDSDKVSISCEPNDAVSVKANKLIGYHDCITYTVE